MRFEEPRFITIEPAWYTRIEHPAAKHTTFLADSEWLECGDGFVHQQVILLFHGLWIFEMQCGPMVLVIELFCIDNFAVLHIRKGIPTLLFVDAFVFGILLIAGLSEEGFTAHRAGPWCKIGISLHGESFAVGNGDAVAILSLEHCVLSWRPGKGKTETGIMIGRRLGVDCYFFSGGSRYGNAEHKNREHGVFDHNLSPLSA